jgi:predicted Zn-dependent peptidase
MKEITNLNTDSLVVEFRKALNYQAQVYYTGTLSYEEIQQMLTEKLPLKKITEKSESPVVIDETVFPENTIWFVNRKDALQSKIYVMVNGETYKKEQDAYVDAFNQYFNGDFSGLVLQEIREYRSLAYGASADYMIPPLPGKKGGLIGYVGTQADKTTEALDVFTMLIKTMPEKPERTTNIRNYLAQSALTSRPGFRNLGETVYRWQLRGYHDDPNKDKYATYTNLSFDHIKNFYLQCIQPKPVVFAIVGDKKRVDMKGIEKYGKIIEVKEKSLFK